MFTVAKETEAKADNAAEMAAKVTAVAPESAKPCLQVTTKKIVRIRRATPLEGNAY